MLGTVLGREVISLIGMCTILDDNNIGVIYYGGYGLLNLIRKGKR